MAAGTRFLSLWANSGQLQETTNSIITVQLRPIIVILFLRQISYIYVSCESHLIYQKKAKNADQEKNSQKCFIILLVHLGRIWRRKKPTHYFAKTTPPRGNARTKLQVDELTKLSISRYL